MTRGEANLSAERAVIAWYLYLRNAHPRSSPLRPEHFTADRRHADWWRKAISCEWDDTTTEHALGASLADLAECDKASHPSPHVITGHERAIMSAWAERHFADACGAAFDGYKSGEMSLAAMMNVVRAAMGNVEAGSLRRSKTYRELGEKVLLDWAGAVLHGKERRRTVPMPWYAIQCQYGGWTRGKMHVIGGRTSEHKTTVVRQSLQYAAHHGFRCLLRTLEDTGPEIAARGIASASALDTKSLAIGALPEGYTAAAGPDLTSDAQRHLEDVEGELLRIGDRGATTLSQLIGEIRAEAGHGLDVAAIDYAQLILADGRSERDADFWRLASSTLAALAKELDIVLLITCQIDKVGSRASETTNRPPKASDILFASSWMQDAWFVVMIYVLREKDPSTHETRRTDRIIFVVEKCKTGPVESHQLKVVPQHDRIEG